MNTKSLLLPVIVLCCLHSRAQNLLQNSGFENYSGCPSALAMVDSCIGWFTSVQTSDYYNCNFLEDFNYPNLNDTAFDGTGFMGFADYGDPNGSGEAIGQTLATPLIPGTTYYVSFAAAKVFSGNWASSCVGVALYGFKTGVPVNAQGIHVSDSAGSMLLGVTDTISNNLWETFSFDFIPTDTIFHIVFTTGNVPDCKACLFLDAIIISDDSTSSTQDLQEEFLPVVYPNPGNGDLTVAFPYAISNCSVEIIDLAGRLVYSFAEAGRSHSVRLSLHELSAGSYLMYMKSDGRFISSVPIQIVQ